MRDGTAGHQLWQVQLGLTPTDYRPMPLVGAGCYEIRIHHGGEFRVIYVAKFIDAVYVLHAFQKTRQLDIELAKRRFRQIEAE
jgi:phage-related protein